LTIPDSIRKELDLEEDTVLSLVKVGDALLLTPRPLMVETLAKRAKRELKRAGLSIEDLLADLDRQRIRYNKERHGA
jgi:bifunctional DNA-binding transcriptional regulator/antitoxin component of YhaV-PrlF toxin-antitoxin module